MPVLKIKQNGEWVEVGGAGVSSWNDLKDKPFNEVFDTLTWDGNTDGLHILSGSYKVSDVVPTLDDFANGGSVIFNTGESIVFNRDGVKSQELADGKYIIGIEADGNSFAIIPDMGEEMAAYGYIPGVYFYIYEGRYVTSLTINGYTGFHSIKTLDSKYLPANVATQEYVDEAISSIPAWAKAASKPIYTAAEVGAVTEAQVTTMINNALGVIENGAY